MKRLIWLLAILGMVCSSWAQEDLPELEVITPENAGRLEDISSTFYDTRQVSKSPDDTMIAIAFQHADADYNVLIYDSETNNKIGSVQGRMDSFRQIIWSPDSKRMAIISGRTTGGGVEERSIKTYTIALSTNHGYYMTGNSDTWYSDYINSNDPPGNPVVVVWNPESNMIALALYERLEIYDIVSDKMLVSQPVAYIYSLDWFANGKTIVTKSTDTPRIRLWGIPTQ